MQQELTKSVSIKRKRATSVSVAREKSQRAIQRKQQEQPVEPKDQPVRTSPRFTSFTEVIL